MILNANGGLVIHCLPSGVLMVNCYILLAPAGPDGKSGPCWVVDPGDDASLAFLAKKDLHPERIVITHGHADHLIGVPGLKRTYPEARITASVGDAGMLTDPKANLSAMMIMALVSPPADQTVKAGDELALGSLTWRVLDVAGHTPGGAAFYCAQAGVVIVGDALFSGSIGRFDLPGGDEQTLLRNIHRNLLSLPDDTRVLPGHGEPTTIGREKRENPYLEGFREE